MSVQAVLVFVLSVAAAVWLLGAALYVWPSPDQLAYGNPLPYLKVGVERPANAVKVWVEDYAGVPYEGVWFYVNGELKASGGGPGTSAYAKCGDEVRAVVKYASGVKKAEGRIQCTNPIKPPSRPETMDYYAARTALAARAITGDMDVTNEPIRITGVCRDDGILMRIFAVQPNVLIGTGHTYSDSFSLYYKPCYPGGEVRICGPYIYRVEKRRQFVDPYYIGYALVPIDVFKIPDAAGSQFLGGRRYVLDVEFSYLTVRELGGGGIIYYEYLLKVNGSTVARCMHYVRSVSYRYSYNVTRYKEPNATGLYTVAVTTPNNTVLSGTVVLYQNPDGSLGFKLAVNPNAEASPPQVTGIVSGSPIATPLSASCGELYEYWETNTFMLQGVLSGSDPLSRFLNNETLRKAYAEALCKASSTEYNLKRQPYDETIRVRRTITWVETIRRSDTITMSVSVLNPMSLGAVYATTIVPLNIKIPPVRVANATTLRTYIAS